MDDDNDEMTSIRTFADPSADTDSAEIIDKSLPVIRWLSIGAIVAGTGSLVLGILSIILSSPLYSWPYTSCSGIYSGVPAILQGACGFQMLRRFDRSFPHSTQAWVAAFYSLGITGLAVAPQHFVFSIIGVSMCVSRQTDKHGIEHCNPDIHGSIVAVEAVSIVFALVFEMVAISTAVYMYRKRRLLVLTGNPYAGKCYSCCCCCHGYYRDI